MVRGSLTTDGKEVQVTGRLRGAQITFTAGGAQYDGRVDGNTMTGTRKAGTASAAFTATRK